MTEVRERELRIRRRTSDGIEARWTVSVGSAAMNVSPEGESEDMIFVVSKVEVRVGELEESSVEMWSMSFLSKGLAAIDLNKEVS